MEFNTFLGGVAASIMAVVVITLVKKIWQSFWLQGMFSQTSANISGDYTGEYWELGDEDDKQTIAVDLSAEPDGKEKIELLQNGRRISGRIVREVVDGTDRISTFTGESADRHITGTYFSKDPKNPERGSFCLKISNRGSTLRGGYLWYNTSEGKESIDYGRYVWKRKK